MDFDDRLSVIERFIFQDIDPVEGVRISRAMMWVHTVQNRIYYTDESQLPVIKRPLEENKYNEKIAVEILLR